MSDQNITQIEETPEAPKKNVIVRAAGRVGSFFRTKTGKVVTAVGATAGAGIATYWLGFRGGTDNTLNILQELYDHQSDDEDDSDEDEVEIEVEEIDEDTTPDEE